jgi:2-keto-3-deoxy-L-rhamnonate aldolase RhmA
LCSTCTTALAGKPTIARVPIGAFALASQLMDSGACGILAPMIDSGKDARRLVDSVKFPPLGQRSWGPRAALPLSGPDIPATTRAYARTIGLRIHISRRDGASELLWRLEPEVRGRRALSYGAAHSTCIFWESAVSSGNVSV